MSWRKHFSTASVLTQDNRKKRTSNNSNTTSNVNSWLPEFYEGVQGRVNRYAEYDRMDTDSEINTALDTISEFSTQNSLDYNLPFDFTFNEQPTEAEAKILRQVLGQWCRLNEWERRLFDTFRNTIKYGDQVFIRDPDTWKLYFVQAVDVKGVGVDEEKLKNIVHYVITNIEPNLADMVMVSTKKHPDRTFHTVPRTGYNLSSLDTTEFEIDSAHVVHLSLNNGMQSGWPFGVSLLENIFKTFKQKELLEDSIIIYRIQRAPERRVFKIDTGDLPAPQAMAYLEQLKNEVQQRRIPNQTGGGTNMMDAQYNPISMLDDYWFAQSSDGRGSTVDTLQGGGNLGDIDDLKFFNNKLARGLRVPSSYMPTGPDDGTAAYNDGRVGSAYIQEFRFSKFCQRLQSAMQPVLDKEFKMFLKHRGFNIDSSNFELVFNEPQHFAQYRQIEIDGERVNLFNSIVGSPYISKRFAMEKYLGLTPEQIVENEKMWKEENPNKKPKGGVTTDEGFDSGLGDIGISGADIDDFGSEDFGDDIPDMESDMEIDAGNDMPDSPDVPEN